MTSETLVLDRRSAVIFYNALLFIQASSAVVQENLASGGGGELCANSEYEMRRARCRACQFHFKAKSDIPSTDMQSGRWLANWSGKMRCENGKARGSRRGEYFGDCMRHPFGDRAPQIISFLLTCMRRLIGETTQIAVDDKILADMAFHILFEMRSVKIGRVLFLSSSSDIGFLKSRAASVRTVT